MYGDSEPSFTEFMSPGIIIMIIYFLAVALTGEAFIMERSSGLLERSWVAGVKPSEILASHILVQCCVMLVQTAITLSFILYVFSVPCHGPLLWLALLTVLQGLAGMSFGFLISAAVDTQVIPTLKYKYFSHNIFWHSKIFFVLSTLYFVIGL